MTSNCCFDFLVATHKAPSSTNTSTHQQHQQQQTTLAVAAAMQYPLSPILWLRHLEAIVQNYEDTGEPPRIIKSPCTRRFLTFIKRLLCPLPSIFSACKSADAKMSAHIDRRWRLTMVPQAVLWSMYEQRKLKELLGRLESMFTVEVFTPGHYMLAEACFGNYYYCGSIPKVEEQVVGSHAQVTPAKVMECIKEIRGSHLRFV